MFESNRRPLAAGDRFPNFVMRDTEDRVCELYTAISGGPIMVLVLAPGDTAGANVLNYIRQNAGPLDERALQTFVICEPALANGDGPARLWLLPDADGSAAESYLGMAQVKAPAAFVLDPNQRIVGVHAGADPFALMGAVTATLDRHACDREQRAINGMAPVLMIPNVLAPDMVARLIALWESGHDDGMVRHGDDDGGDKTVNYGFKRRRDHVIDDPDLDYELTDLLFPRIAQEVAKVHYLENWIFERFRVGCYEATDAGFFAPHRDNFNVDVQHRKFAVTVNLNSGDYEGGGLRFPEYGPEVFSPPTGGAILFSCSLLHEVLPVTSGRRFTLLNFLLANSPAGA